MSGSAAPGKIRAAGTSSVSGSLKKLCLNLLETLLIAACLLYHLVFIQYTVTAGLLAAAAIFTFLTQRKGRGRALPSGSAACLPHCCSGSPFVCAARWGCCFCPLQAWGHLEMGRGKTCFHPEKYGLLLGCSPDSGRDSCLLRSGPAGLFGPGVAGI